MTGASLGVAVIGYGWMARLHAQAYLRLRHHYPQLPATWPATLSISSATCSARSTG